jgi:hypothetical protein
MNTDLFCWQGASIRARRLVAIRASAEEDCAPHHPCLSVFIHDLITFDSHLNGSRLSLSQIKIL